MNSFNLYEDILSRTWNRYYYEVEAETLEEAIEKVKDGEVDCYDSEQLYESTDDLAPEEFSAGCISFTLVKEVLEKLGWTDTEDLETNGWDIDYWVTFIKEGKNFDYIVSGSLYYGNINIRKEKF